MAPNCQEFYYPSVAWNRSPSLFDYRVLGPHTTLEFESIRICSCQLTLNEYCYLKEVHDAVAPILVSARQTPISPIISFGCPILQTSLKMISSIRFTQTSVFISTAATTTRVCCPTGCPYGDPFQFYKFHIGFGLSNCPLTVIVMTRPLVCVSPAGRECILQPFYFSCFVPM